MGWSKEGLIFVPKSNGKSIVSHAQGPVVDDLDNGLIRIYFGTRNSENHTQTTYIEARADNPKNITYVHDEIVLGCGELGCFDDGGTMPSCIVNYNGTKYLYYVGWNAGVTVSYRNSIGIAVSEDGGRSFSRLFNGPIVDRTRTEPHFCSTPYVIIEDNVWKMWYQTAIDWKILDDHPEPFSDIKYAESEDGIVWRREGRVAIALRPGEGGLAKPHVIKEDGIYKMWYAHRGARDYRTNPDCAYRIGYAESSNGIDWERKDEQAGIDVSESGWDSTMIEYPCVYDYAGKRYMLYNGNGFGEAGIGLAVWED